MSTPNNIKSYFLRAVYDWCMDNGLTPHVVSYVNEHTSVPKQYVRDNEIVLNISPTACQDLKFEDEWVTFSARFAGKSHEIWLPIGHITGIFSRENGNGMGFEAEEYKPLSDNQTDNQADNPAKDIETPQHEDDPPTSHLTLVKRKK